MERWRRLEKKESVELRGVQEPLREEEENLALQG